ncbi:MAG: hypothetical protein JO071_13930 [Deltaproteobacteria bacterium]|nr:hypothetical protein [Deltaproteobacteria bacterium]
MLAYVTIPALIIIALAAWLGLRAWGHYNLVRSISLSADAMPAFPSFKPALSTPCKAQPTSEYKTWLCGPGFNVTSSIPMAACWTTVEGFQCLEGAKGWERK